MRHLCWAAVLAVALATGVAPRPAAAQIEIRQNGDLVFGAPGTPLSNTTAIGNFTADYLTASKTLTAPGNTTLGTSGATPASTTTVYGNTTLGTTASTTSIPGYLNAPYLNAPATLILGDVTLGKSYASPPSSITIDGNLVAPALTAATTSITGNTVLGTAGSGNSTTVNGNLVAPSLTARTTTVSGDMSIGGNLNAPTLSAPITTVSGSLNAARLTAATTTVTNNLVVNGTVSAGGAPLRNSLFYVQTDGADHRTTSSTPEDIPGLQFTLPAASAIANYALVTLNVPNPYAVGGDYPGVGFQITAGGTAVGPVAVFTYSVRDNAGGPGRIPTTLVVPVTLGATSQVVKAQWNVIRVSTGIIDTLASLSAVTGWKD